MKPNISSLCSLFLLAAGLFVNPLAGRAQTDPQFQWNDDYRTKYEVPVGTYTGKSPFMRSSMETPPPASPAPAPLPGNATWAKIWISKNMPPLVSTGEEFDAQLEVRAEGNADNVVVRDVLPEGVACLRSEPAGSQEGNQMVWRVGKMASGTPVIIKMRLRADRAGSLVNCASAAVEPSICVPFTVGEPKLVIEKTGPTTAIVGSSVVYTIVVRNTGNANAVGVVVTDPVPGGLSHASGQSELSVNIGTLPPGQSRTLTATFKADGRGNVCNVATVNSANAGRLTAQACTAIQQPGLKLTKTGPAAQIIGRHADYTLNVVNTGDMPLSNVSVVDSAPAGTVISGAPGAAINGNQAQWTISQLAPGETKQLDIKLTGQVAGNTVNTATATVPGLNLSDTATASTAWRGVAGVLIELVDSVDPIQVGETTVYTIRIMNQGFADVHNVKTVFECDANILPVSSEQGTVSGQSVNFPVATIIGPKATLTYTIIVKGVQPGDSHNRVTISTDELRTSIMKEESTTVY